MSSKILVPELGESVVEATVSRWLKQEGDSVSVGETLLELETDKVDLEVGAEQAGVLARIEIPAGTDVKIGDVLGLIEDAPKGEGVSKGNGVSAKNDAPPPAPKPPAAKPDEKPAPDGGISPPKETLSPEKITPVARRVAQDLGVDASKVQGTGSGGRITRQDVEQASAKPAPPPSSSALPENSFDGDGNTSALNRPPPLFSIPARKEERVRMTRRRRTIAARLVEAQHTAAMLTTFNEMDMRAVMDIRARRKEAFREKHGVSLGLSSFFVKAAIGALKAFPRLNAEMDGDEMILKHYYDIGVAIGAEEGLVVPVLRDADRMSFAEIEQNIKDFVRKTQDGTLSLEDLQGGTFTITNGGVFGSLLSTPILNAPQVGILGLHKIEERPVAADGQVVIRPMMYVALSYDHRIVDGRDAVQFLVRVKELIEDPETLLLEG